MKYDVKIYQKINLKETQGFSPSKSTKIKDALLGKDAVNKWVQVCSVGKSLTGEEISSKFISLFVEDFYTFDYPGPVYLGHIDYERKQGQPEPSAAAYVRALELTTDGDLYALYEYRTETWKEVESGGFHFNSIFGIGLYEGSEDNGPLDPIAVSFKSIAITNTPAVDGLKSMILSTHDKTNRLPSYLILSRTKGIATMSTEKELKLEADKEMTDKLKDEIKTEILDELKTDDTALAEDTEEVTKDAPSDEELAPSDNTEEDGPSAADELSASLIETLTQLTGAETPLTHEEAMVIAVQMAQEQLAAMGGSSDSDSEEESLMEDALAASKTRLITLTKENEELKLELVTHTVESDIKAIGADEAALDGLLVVLQTAGQEAYNKLLSTLNKKTSTPSTKDSVNSTSVSKEVIEKTVVASTNAELEDKDVSDKDSVWLTTFRNAFGTNTSKK